MADPTDLGHGKNKSELINESHRAIKCSKVHIFLAALSSSRRLVVHPSVGWSVQEVCEKGPISELKVEIIIW